MAAHEQEEHPCENDLEVEEQIGGMLDVVVVSHVELERSKGGCEGVCVKRAGQGVW